MRVTAVIDIGSNSARMAVFERTSRFGFHLLCEVKSRVRISERAYINGGVLQEEAMTRAIGALADFAKIAKSYGARKTLCVATSAVRDAPNRSEFISRVRKATGLQIRVIKGEEEARLGGIAAANLLAIDNGVTIDIGGGSTELALIKNSRVVGGVSFNLGTVRLKELFFDKDGGADEAADFVRSELSKLPEEFRCETIVGVGGTMRSLASAIIKRENYPFEALHGYSFEIARQGDFIESVLASDCAGLKALGIKQDRFDVIREGTLIFKLAAAAIGARNAVTSGVGVREGAFLSDLLRSEKGKLPNDIQPSLISALDRFGDDRRQIAFVARTTMKLFDALEPLHKLSPDWKKPLLVAAKLAGAGRTIDPYYPAAQESLLTLHALSYGFSHADRLLIAALLRMQTKKELCAWQPQKGFEKLLPSADTTRKLAFTLFLARTINAARDCAPPTLELNGSVLTIKNLSYLAKESFKTFNKFPIDLEIAAL